MAKRFPVHKLKTRAKELDLGDAKVHQLPNWHNLTHPQRLAVIRQIAMRRGRDPRIAKLAVQILKANRVPPREYTKQAGALLAWVQNPKNVYYVNEPGERLQDPIYTIKVGHGDCFAADTLVLRRDMELVKIQDVVEGDEIWGRDRWSTVTKTWDKGELPITEIELNNGSVLRLTEGHKVYVRSCCGPKAGEVMGNGVTCKRSHGPSCATRSSALWKQCTSRHGTEIIRIKVSELEAGMEILQPESIDQPDRGSESPDSSWLVGAYIADGWAEATRVMISGKDGHWKEGTKHRVRDVADTRLWHTRRHDKYIAINDLEAVELVAGCGLRATEKQVPLRWLQSGHLVSLEEGLRLDASQNSRGEGWTYGTVSHKLAVQYRVLQRMLGRSTSWRKVQDHGGLGENPIYRVGVRSPESTADKRLRVKAIRREVEKASCYDIATDDHYVYLPEADCTVSNCDDQVILLCSLFESIGLPWRLVLSGRQGPAGQSRKVRYIEGNQLPPGTRWTHIYCMVGDKPGIPTRWYFAETTVVGVPLGWDVIEGDHRYLPEMVRAKPGQAAQIMPSPRWDGRKPAAVPPKGRRSPAYVEAYGALSYGEALGSVGSTVGASVAEAAVDEDGLNWKEIGKAVATGVTVAVLTQIALDWVRGRGIWEDRGNVISRTRHLLGVKE